MPEEIKVIEEEGQRLYDVPDVDKLPSVTTITSKLDKSEALKGWAAKITANYFIDNIIQRLKEGQLTIKDIEEMEPKVIYKQATAEYRKVQKTAKDIGTYVHEAAEAIFRAMLENSPLDIPIDEDIEKPVKAILVWIKDNDVSPIAIEQKVWAILPGLEFGFAGRLDLVAYVNEKLTTIDLKAATGIYDDSPLQIAAYDLGYNNGIERGEREGPHTEGSAILRLDKETGMPEYREYTRDQTDDYFNCFSMLCGFWHMDKQRKENERIRKQEQREKVKEEKKAKKTEDPY